MMKILLSLTILLAVGLSGFSQSTAKAYIGLLPPLPDGACTMTNAEKHDYLVVVSELADKIDKEIARRKKEQKEFASASQYQIQQNMAKQMGLSPSEIAKMNNGGQLSKEEKSALAGKMMSEKFNMSVGEAKSIQKMSKEGKAAYAEVLGTEMMANAHANPAKMKADQQKQMGNYQLLQKQGQLISKIQAQQEKFRKQFEDVENDTSETHTLREIDKLTSDLLNRMGEVHDDGAKIDAVANKIKTAKAGYCNKFTPRYFDVYRQYLNYINESISDYDQMEVANRQVMEVQTGVSDKMAEPGLMALELVEGYIGKLQDVFRFAIYDSDKGY